MSEADFIVESTSEDETTAKGVERTGWETVVFELEDEESLLPLSFGLFDSGDCALEADLRVGAVAEGLGGGAAAAAERRLLHRNRIAKSVGERELTLDDIRAVVFDLDVDRH
jgi:hypothetical protein